MANRKWGFHSGKLECKNLDVEGNLDVNGNFSFGDSSVDNFILNGRFSTVTAAGSNITIGSTSTYPEGFELRYTVDSWAGIGTSATATGQYLRIQNNSANTSGSLKGLQVLTYDNAVGTGMIEGGYFETGVKAIAGNKTTGPIFGIEDQISQYSPSSGTLTLTTANNVGIGGLRVQLGLGSGLADYTKVYGLLIWTNDASTGTRTLGSAINIANYPSEGTQTWTKGIEIDAATTTGLSIEGTTGTAIAVTSASHIMTAAGAITGSTAYDCFDLTVTDSSTGSSGYARGIHVDAVVSGNKTGSGEHNSIAIDQTVTGNTPYLYGFVYYSASAVNPTIGQCAPISIYQDNLGNALSEYTAVDIGLNFTNAPSGRFCYFRLRNHSGTTTPDTVLKLEGSGTSTYLLNIDVVAGLLSTSTGATSVTHKIAVKTPAGDRYIKLYSDA